MDRPDYTIATYNKCAREYADKFMDMSMYKKNISEFIKLLKPNSKILDIGCGPGNVSKLLVSEGFEVVGIDFSVEMIKLAKKYVPKARFIQGDIRKIDFDKGVDAVIGAFILPCLAKDETKALFKKINKTLNKGGLLYLSFMEGRKSGFETTSFSPNGEIYFNYHDSDMVQRALVKNSFEVIKRSKQDYLEPDGSITFDIIIFAKKK